MITAVRKSHDTYLHNCHSVHQFNTVILGGFLCGGARHDPLGSAVVPAHSLVLVPPIARICWAQKSRSSLYQWPRGPHFDQVSRNHRLSGHAGLWSPRKEFQRFHQIPTIQWALAASERAPCTGPISSWDVSRVGSRALPSSACADSCSTRGEHLTTPPSAHHRHLSPLSGRQVHPFLGAELMKKHNIKILLFHNWKFIHQIPLNQ